MLNYTSTHILYFPLIFILILLYIMPAFVQAFSCVSQYNTNTYKKFFLNKSINIFNRAQLFSFIAVVVKDFLYIGDGHLRQTHNVSVLSIRHQRSSWNNTLSAKLNRRAYE